MAKGMKIVAWLSLLTTAIFTMIYRRTPQGAILTIAITAGTIAYHFWMRLLVGGFFHAILKNKVDYHKKWFRVGKREHRLYRLLKVKKWKKFIPTYDPEAFDPGRHSWEEIAGAMCQSEWVHETIAVLSFLPILASFWFGATRVFLGTSLFAAAVDVTFVILQRYNRPRVLKMINRSRK